MPERVVMKAFLHVGGGIAVGFDSSGEYLLTITHSGRGVFSTRTWARVARNTAPGLTEGDIGIGIGPVEGQSIPVTEMNYDTGNMRVVSADGRIVLDCESSGIEVTVTDTE